MTRRRLVWLLAQCGEGRIARAVRMATLRQLARMRAGVGALVALLALRRLSATAPPAAPPRVRPPNAPRGVRRGRVCTPARGAIRLIPAGRGVRGRIAALARVLDTLDVWVERMALRLRRETFVTAYVLRVAPADPLRAQSVAAPDTLDSS